MKQPGDDTITLGDRVATGVLSGIFAAVTLLCYFVIAYSWGALHGWTTDLRLYREFVTSGACPYIVGAAVVAGFVLGSTRMTSVFSFFWGTSDK